MEGAGAGTGAEVTLRPSACEWAVLGAEGKGCGEVDVFAHGYYTCSISFRSYLVYKCGIVTGCYPAHVL